MNYYNKVFVDSGIDSSILKKLASFGIEAIKIPKNPFLDDPICAHPDMNILKIGYKTFVLDKKYAKIAGNSTCIEFEHNIKCQYPYDVKLNAAMCGKDIICNKNYIAKEASDFANAENFRIINVKQGYAKCNICIVNDNSIITEDSGIAKVLADYSYNILLLETHYVKLNGYQYGFIGGASGKISENKLGFCGDISKHPEYTKIYNFCKKFDTEPVSLSNIPLYDYGSIVKV